MSVAESGLESFRKFHCECMALADINKLCKRNDSVNSGTRYLFNR